MNSANTLPTAQTATVQPALILPAPIPQMNVFAAPPVYLASTTPNRGLRVNAFAVAQVVNVVYAG